jgi:hypothetical protein
MDYGNTSSAEKVGKKPECNNCGIAGPDTCEVCARLNKQRQGDIHGELPLIRAVSS